MAMNWMGSFSVSGARRSQYGALRAAAYPRAIIALAASLTAAIVLLAVPGLALASGPPAWPQPPKVLIVHSTRVLAEMVMETGFLATTWKAEIVPICTGSGGSCTSEECEQELPAGGWKTVNEGEFPATTNHVEVELGGPDPGDPGSSSAQLGALSPETCYVVRLSATNDASELESGGKLKPVVGLVRFKTNPVEKPEVPKVGPFEERPESDVRVSGETDDGFTTSAKIESNGADSAYVFEYALPENGGLPAVGSSLWKVFSTDSSGSVSAAQDYAIVTASTSGLSPETAYYVRIKMTNERVRHSRREILLAVRAEKLL